MNEPSKWSFDQVAELYDKARPGYPRGLFEDLFLITGLSNSASILEVGCGTGQASLSLAQRCGELVCLDLGENMVGLARKNLSASPHVRVEQGAFETWRPQHPFDMVFAASCWHWLDPQVRFQRAAAALVPSGYLAIVSSCHAYPIDADPAFEDIQRAYEKIGEAKPGATVPHPKPDQVPDQQPDMVASGCFEFVGAHRYLWQAEYDATNYLDLLSTYSDHLAMDPSRRQLLFSEIRGVIERRPSRRIRKHYLTILSVGKRV